jgi:3-hydroxyisobutyrate dehydrogenase
LRIGFIGAGVMGAPMAGHLLAAGHHVAVHNRSPAKTAPLLEAGAALATSPAAAAREADVVITIVGFPDDVRRVYLGGEGAVDEGIVAVARRDALLIDMTTSSPSLAREIHAAAAARGAAALDAPVSGGDVGARNGTLSIMVGGEAEAFERARPVLERMGKTIVHQGGPGAGQHAKMANQIAIAGTMIGVCEALAYAKRAGLDASTLLSSIGAGAAGSWTMDNLAPRMIAEDWSPGFFVRHYLKDLGIALAEAERMALDLPGLALAKGLYEGLRDHVADGGDLGTQALMRVVGEAGG